jgi:hypothetical protein
MTDKDFARLAWSILEAKVRYYMFPDLENINDAIYDQKEAEYDAECQLRHVDNHFKGMVGCGLPRESLKLAIEKVRSRG